MGKRDTSVESTLASPHRAFCDQPSPGEDLGAALEQTATVQAAAKP
jgi:hypothetical protein